MANEIKLPELGENVEEGEVVEVHVAQGAEVKEGQPLLEVEAGKSTVEVPSPVNGRISQVLIKKGDSVKTGQRLFVVEPNGTPTTKTAEPAQHARAAVPPTQPPARAEERPARPPERQAPAPARGDGKTAPVPALTPAPPTPAAATVLVAAPAPAEKLVPASPATRLLARQLGVDLAQVRGRAPHGRVTQEDVKAFVHQQMTTGPARGVPPPLPDFTRWGPVESKPLDSVRRKTAEHMALSWSQVPHVTQHDLADVTDLDAFRRQQSGKGPNKLTVTAFVLKGAAIALRQFPQFNASIDPAANQLLVKHYYHIGVAVDTERGLLVPVLRDVDRKSVHQIAQELAELAERARQRKLAADDLRGGNFTVTNLGGIGGTAFTPIVNWPEVAILGLSRATLQPVVRDGQVVPRLLLPLSLSYDHRVIDGANAARFTRRLAEMLENPLVMLLDA
jgi:pyruvate dehydrogenase E2 component (dihydrolipoamide acetyltransferase)